jgi:hypothetical protein
MYHLVSMCFIVDEKQIWYFFASNDWKWIHVAKSSVKADSLRAVHDISRLLYKPKVRYHADKFPPLNRILNEINIVHSLPYNLHA